MRTLNGSEGCNPLIIKDTGTIFVPERQRVILRPYLLYNEVRIERVISRVMALGESDIRIELQNVIDEFSHRHHNFEGFLERQFNLVRRFMPSDVVPSRERRLLLGSYFSTEYSFESVALFNPSIVQHPDQSGLPRGSLRFILTLRATGEGHFSSLKFRSGSIDVNNDISIDDPSGFAITAEMRENTIYDRTFFARKLRELGVNGDFSKMIINSLSDEFTFTELMNIVQMQVHNHKPLSASDSIALEKIQWLARCNYEAHFDPSVPLSERVIYPLSPSEQNGIEDARFVLFTEDDGTRKYFATYTAYDGKAILPQLMETKDFVHFKIITLNGTAAVNKGMAMFPRKIGGRYAMISRQDGENLFIMFSENIHIWNEIVPLMRPSYPWEFVQIGNCGSPIETDKGWLLLTHGVGPLRQYSIGAILLDTEDPSKILGRLKEPLIKWTENSRSGYVPNVVYTCGALPHNDVLIVPYARSDQEISISLISLPSLLEELLHGTK